MANVLSLAQINDLLGNVGGGGGLGGPTNVVVIAKQTIPLRHQITAADLETAKASVNGNATLGNGSASRIATVVAGPVMTKAVSSPFESCPTTQPASTTSFAQNDPFVVVWVALLTVPSLTTHDTVRLGSAPKLLGFWLVDE